MADGLPVYRGLQQCVQARTPERSTGKMPVLPIRFHSCMRFQRLITVPAMASFVRHGVIAASLGILLFSTSCEMHPPGQMPDVQREQPDPAKVYSNATEQHSEATRVEGPQEAR
jgi:hypothetical protein